MRLLRAGDVRDPGAAGPPRRGSLPMRRWLARLLYREPFDALDALWPVDKIWLARNGYRW